MMPQVQEKKLAQVIDGKKHAGDVRTLVARHVFVLIEDHKIMPTLAVVLVGDDPASLIYVNNKRKAAAEVGMRSLVHHLPAKTSQDEVLKLVQKLNKDKKVNGVLVQMPLPKQVDAATILRAVDPIKDVDGLSVENAGRLATGQAGLVPCTPLGCLYLIKKVQKNMTGLHAVVVGRSHLVGKPMAQLLLRENCTVTTCHSRTKNIRDITRQGDILVVAAGREKMITGDMVKEGAIVIDVGINRQKSGKLCGDVDFDSVSCVAGFITPVPGGVGPMTIACLLANTVTATCRQYELMAPHIF